MWNDATWNMAGYIAKYGFQVDENHHDLTQQEVERIFQLDPEPPFQEQVNQYIIQAVQTHDLRNLSYFLHHYERLLNGHVHSFLRRSGELRSSPDRFLDLKLSCLGAILDKLPDYDPDKGAEFTTYIYPFLEDVLLTSTMGEEGYSFDSLDQYKRVRSAAWHASNSQTLQEAIAAFAAEAGCREETATKYLTAAAASPVYELLGHTGLVMEDDKPQVDKAYIEGDLGYRYHEGGHTDAPDWPAFFEFARKYIEF